MGSNYLDVLGQIQAAGLLVETLQVGTLKPVRVRVEGDREKRGWYKLHELRLPGGDDLVVGSYGIWRGNEANAVKVAIDAKTAKLTSEQREAIRKRQAEDLKKAKLERAREAERAAQKARKAWSKCSQDGDSDYLSAKGVQAHGVRFSPQGAMVVPMLDVSGLVHGLQIIRGKPKADQPQRRLPKEFWPVGLAKKGHFHLIGGVPTSILLVAEGYATAASLYEATGLPVAVAFDAGNLAPVAEALHKRHKTVKILVCADDDRFSEGNPGVTAASAAAMMVGGAFLVPVFADEAARELAFETKGQKITDFNDLHAAEGLHVVRQQVQDKLQQMGWTLSKRRTTAVADAVVAGGLVEKAPLRPVDNLDELLERYSLIYGQGGTVFDHAEHRLVALSDMRDLCASRDLFRAWCDHPDRMVVRPDGIGFDPAGTDERIKCNLWAGWPTVPQKGQCDQLLGLLWHMCSNEGMRANELYQWVLKWLAYPIQHPGAKMKSTLVIHGPQGTGKNMFFEAIMAIYGQYGWVIDQSAIEDKFNDWASRKLFLIADEVVARSEMFHIKNKLKSFITGTQIRINPKNMQAYWEANHVNMVFLSNEPMPVVLEEDDRRHAVIWTPDKLSQDYYTETQRELDNGGRAALHHYLMHEVDLGDFTSSTPPPMTDAKQELIGLSMDSPSAFVTAFRAGDLPGFPALNAPKLLTPCLNQDFYDLYVEWCRRMGLRSLNQPKFLNQVQRKFNAQIDRKRVGYGNPLRVLSLPGGHEKPVAEHESDWLAQRVEAFKVSLRDFRGLQGGPT